MTVGYGAIIVKVVGLFTNCRTTLILDFFSMKAADYLPNISIKKKVLLLSVHFSINLLITIFSKLKIHSRLELNKIKPLKKNIKIIREPKSKLG